MRVSKHVVTEESRLSCSCAARSSASNTSPSPPEHPSDDVAHELGTGQDVVIVLYAERANVATEVVPVEQVTVHTDVLTEQQSLWGTVSHEEITINDDTHATQLE